MDDSARPLTRVFGKGKQRDMPARRAPRLDDVEACAGSVQSILAEHAYLNMLVNRVQCAPRVFSKQQEGGGVSVGKEAWSARGRHATALALHSPTATNQD